MTEFTERDFYNEYLENCYNQIDSLNKQLHDNFIKIYSLYYSLLENYDLIIKYKIPILDIINLKVVGNKILKRIFVNRDKDFINEYNSLLRLIKENNKLKVILSKYIAASKIHYKVYKVIQHSINYEIHVHLLKGRSYYFPKIGEIYIGRVPYDDTIPDWGNSYKFRDFLNSQGVATKDKDNPNGKLWLVGNGLNRPDFVLMRWKKASSPLRNKEPYRLFPSVFGNIYGKILDKPFTIEELFEKTDTGLFDKIIHIYKYHYEYATQMYPFIKIYDNSKEIETDNEINL